MYIVKRSARFVEAFFKAYGPSNLKKFFWEREYSGTKWDFADDTKDDCVYRHLERFTRNGSVLDMGCGSGNTANEMADSSYQSYLGVDISEAALAKATRRSRLNGRERKNQFVCADFESYVPTGKYDVILFRESMYHVPIGRIKSTLDRYSEYLKEDGVFIVRLFAGERHETNSRDKPRPVAMLQIMESEFDVVEKRRYDLPGGPTVLVFRPKARSRETDGISNPVRQDRLGASRRSRV
jgi:SAM-dependent methyltransferase